jgi:hypothetical protein
MDIHVRGEGKIKIDDIRDGVEINASANARLLVQMAAPLAPIGLPHFTTFLLKGESLEFITK